MTEPRTRALVFHAADLGGTKIGGIQSFVRGFAQFAPEDFVVECVGTTSDVGARPLGRWTEIDVEGRSVRYLPVVRTDPLERRSRVPIALSYTLALVRHRRRFATRGRVLNFHRAGVPLALSGSRSPRVQFVHLNVADIYGQRGESRWRRLPGAYHRIEDLTIGSMDRVWVVNEAGVRFYRERHPAQADKFAFLPTWYDPGIFGAPSAAERDREQELNEGYNNINIAQIEVRLPGDPDRGCARRGDQRARPVAVPPARGLCPGVVDDLDDPAETAGLPAAFAGEVGDLEQARPGDP